MQYVPPENGVYVAIRRNLLRAPSPVPTSRSLQLRISPSAILGNPDKLLVYRPGVGAFGDTSEDIVRSPLLGACTHKLEVAMRCLEL